MVWYGMLLLGIDGENVISVFHILFDESISYNFKKIEMNVKVSVSDAVSRRRAPQTVSLLL